MPAIRPKSGFTQRGSRTAIDDDSDAFFRIRYEAVLAGIE
jgi:hypothetical protein